MRLPKTIIICGKEIKIERKEVGGGTFHTGNQEIKIGKNYTSQVVLEMFLHEVMEYVFVERLMRYSLPYSPTENGHYLFSFNHTEFENAIKDIALALRPLLEKSFFSRDKRKKKKAGESKRKKK